MGKFLRSLFYPAARVLNTARGDTHPERLADTHPERLAAALDEAERLGLYPPPAGDGAGWGLLGQFYTDAELDRAMTEIFGEPSGIQQ